MGFDYPPKLFLKQDSENSKSCLGRTAHYDPKEKAITIYTTGRHPKDILRSYAHELVHHTQNLRGDLSPEKCGDMGDKYAQENPHMRKMEEEAYLVGNMCFRDWEDNEKFSLQESKILKENKTMTNKITKESLKGMIRDILEQRMNELYDDEDLPAGGEDLPPDMDDKMMSGGYESNLSPEEAESGWGDGPGSPVPLDNLSRDDLIDVMKSALSMLEGEKDLEEQSKTDSPDRVAGRDAGGRRLDEEEVSEGGCQSGPHKRDDEELEEARDCCGVPGCGHPGDPAKKAMKENEESEIEEAKGEKGDADPLDGERAKFDKDHDGVPDGGDEDPDDPEVKESKIQTPEQENSLYESRFANRNANLFEDLVKKWTK